MCNTEQIILRSEWILNCSVFFFGKKYFWAVPMSFCHEVSVSYISRWPAYKQRHCVQIFYLIVYILIEFLLLLQDSIFSLQVL